MAELVRAGIQVDSAQGVQNVSRAEQAFDKLDKTAQRTNATLSKSNAAFNALKNAAGLVIGVGTVTKFFNDLTSATREGEQAQAKLEAVLKATGFAAGRTAGQLDQLASSLADSTLFDDEAIKNMSAVLATFRNVSGDTFDRAITLGLDMAQVMGGDLTGTAVQLGKALNDPVTGIVALRRVGVTLSENQKQLIQNFIQTNNLAGAQKIILDELANEFGGAAGAANTGLSGAIASAKKNYDNFLESLGRTQQVGGPIQTVFRAIADFWRSRELTTDPLEDMAIALDDAQTRAEGLRGALRSLMEGTSDWIQIARDFDLDIPFIGGGEEAVRAALVERIELTRQQIDATKGAIETENALRKSKEDQARTDAERVRIQAEDDRRASERQSRLEREREEREQRVKAINQEVAALQVQAATLGMTERQATLYQLRMAGATQVNLDAADAALKAIEAFERQQEEMAKRKKELEEEQERARKKAEEEARAFEVMWEQALRNTQDIFADAFENILTGGVTSTGKLLRELWRMWMRFLAQLAAHALFRFVFRLATGGFGGGFGGGTFGVDSAPSGVGAGFAHQGGRVGEPLPTKRVSSAVFLGAPRYHAGGVAGLKPDEVPIIAQKGETIVPKGGGAGRVVVFQFPGGKVFDPSNPEHRRDFVRMMRQVMELHEIDVEVR